MTGAEASGLSRQMQAQVQRQVEAGLQASAADPGLRALLVPDGTPLTVSDASGHVRLTLAGQARVQEVYNRLRLDESYEKHADQATAQAVTLVAAIVLTVATAGTATPATSSLVAGTAGTAGAAAGATAGSLASMGTAGVMLKAGAIGMGSTMIGQWAGGASFDEAFQAGMKSGAISAVAAGVSYGVADSLGLNPVTDQNGVVQGIHGGPANTASNAGTAFNPVQYGSLQGQVYNHLSPLDKLGTGTFWTLAGTRGLTQGALADEHGHLSTAGRTVTALASVTTGMGAATAAGKDYLAIDHSMPIEMQARQAFDLRNTYRNQAREFMSDRITADRLIRDEPNKNWAQILEIQKNRGLAEDRIYKEIIQSSQRTRTSVNKQLGVE